MASTDYVRDEDVQLYRQVLREIKLRMDAATEALARVPPTRFNADLAAVELRIALELVLLGSLVTNRTEIEKVASALHRHDYAHAKKLLERVNPDYWPRPAKQVPEGPDQVFRHEPITEGYLAAADWGRAHGFLSEQVHARNPYKHAPFSEPLNIAYEGAAKIRDQLVTLLNFHEVQLANRDYMLFAMMDTKETGDVSVIRAEVLSNEDAERLREAWVSDKSAAALE